MIPPTDAVLNRLSQEFDFHELREATQNFSASHRLGEGTYGTVFRGTLRDGTEVAIKALASPKEGGFREEVEVLSRFRHPNLVILMGFARHGRERYLVYELLPGGDVHSRLNKDPSFTWDKRLNVVLDCALGLSHLHGSRPQVFHRDVKTQNLLMDKNGTGKVADFGLACLAQPNQRSLMVRETSGTLGYADPLYIRSGEITEKSEVYSLGMVLLEVLTGRPPALQHPNGMIEYQFDHLNGEIRKLTAMVDRRGRWPPAMAECVGHLALQCTCEQASFRPSFVEIVTRLRKWLRDETLQAASNCQSPGQSSGCYRDQSGGQSPAGLPLRPQGASPASPWHDPRANPFGNSLKPLGGGYASPHQQPQHQQLPQQQLQGQQPQQQQQQQQAQPHNQPQPQHLPFHAPHAAPAPHAPQAPRYQEGQGIHERVSWDPHQAQRLLQQQQLQREQREREEREREQRERELREREQRELEQRSPERPNPAARLPFPQRPGAAPGLPERNSKDPRMERPELLPRRSDEAPRGLRGIPNEDGQRSSETYKRPGQQASSPANGYSGGAKEASIPWPRKSWQTFEGGDGFPWAGASDSTTADSSSSVGGQVNSAREAERQKNLAILVGELSFSTEMATQALERCSTVEAAVEWICNSGNAP